MAATIVIKVEDVNTQLATYNRIQLVRAATVGGAYALVTTITIVQDDYFYSYDDSTGGPTFWYKYRFYHATTLTASSYSNPFQPEQVTRKKIRQDSIDGHEMGMVLLAKAGSTASSLLTDDYRVKSTAYRTDRGKGGWIRMTSGTYAGEIVRVTGTTPSTGAFALSPSLTGAPSAGDEFEWHWSLDPASWDRCINKGLARYYYIDRIPIVGVDGQDEHDLTAMLPWLKQKDWVTGVWRYPSWDYNSSSADLADGVEVPFAGGGQWWNVKSDGHAITLQASPAISAQETVFLEAVRPMGPLHTDDSVAPRKCALELASCLAYDEALDMLMKPGSGPEKDRTLWEKERLRHATQELQHLLRKYTDKPRVSPPQTMAPPSSVQPFTAR